MKSFIKSLIARTGYQIVNARRRISMSQVLGHMKRLGLNPDCVIDVGVGYGTPELYKAFPEAHYILIEPLREFETQIKNISARLKAKYVAAAAGPQVGRAVIHVHPHSLQGSSLFHEMEGPDADGEPREISVVRIDDLEPNGRILMKLDTQGAELAALRGAQQTLTRTDAVVMEVSIMGFLAGVPLLAETVAFMKGRGFVAYDFCGGDHRPLDGALSQIDMVFVFENGLFRRDLAYTQCARFSTEEASKKQFTWK